MTDIAAIDAFLDSALAREFGAHVKLIPIPDNPFPAAAGVSPPILPAAVSYSEDA